MTDFVYVVHNETVSLYNWRESQRLSLEAQSGIAVGEGFLKEVIERSDFTYPDRMDFPVPDIGGDGRDAMLISVIDESGKLNINKMVNPNGTIEENQYMSMQRLLNILDVDEAVADLIADWIDKDFEERLSGSETGAKNGHLYSLDELMSIDGITDKIYKKLLPHVTIFGDGKVNINSADKFVLMSIDKEVNEELAKRVISYRELKPFSDSSHIQKVAGFSGTWVTNLMGRLTVKGNAFSVVATVFEEELQRSVTAVLVLQGGKLEYKYWKES